MVIAGLTGSIGSGKTTVANFFKDLGAYIINWDMLAREVVLPHRKAWEEIVEYFGTQVLSKDQEIDRQRLAALVFDNSDKLKKLNQITHPRIMEEDGKLVDEVRRHDPDAIIVKEIPLLSKANSRKFVERVIVVYASEQNQIKRLAQRNLTEEEARKRIKAQPPLSEKMGFADFIIYNDGLFEETRKQVEEVYNILKGGAASGEAR
jgi:dephospho-CoA kinase